MPDPVVHFEIPADDFERAQGFYRGCFGWGVHVVPGLGYALLQTAETDGRAPAAPGRINGGMLRRQAPVDRLVVTVEVQDLDATLAAVARLGGSVLRGKAHVPGVGWAAYVQDTEGNPLGLVQRSP